MKYAAMFLWVIVPVGVYAVFALHGLPHFIFSYSFHDNGDPYNPSAARYYTSCTYIGPYGGFDEPAEYGSCPWVRFFQEGADQ